MKKLMMTVAVVLAAAAVQAATFNWATSAKQYAPNIDLANLAAGTYGSSSSTTLANMSAVTWAFTMALDNGTNTDTINGTPAYKVGKINVTGLESAVVFLPGASDPNNNVNYSIVITGTYKDGNNKDWTITSDPIVGVESFSSLSTLTIGSATATQWTVAGGEPVPEPTSGLLVVLGLAGLALRRRRA